MSSHIKHDNSPVPQKSRISTGKAIGAAVVIAGLVALLIGYYFNAIYDKEVTEDAYVEGNVVQVTAQTSGVVTWIHADNTDFIEMGKVAVSLNPIDADLALQRAAAQLAKTVRIARGQYSAATQMEASIRLREADLSKAIDDMRRRQDLVKTGAISAEDFKHTEDGVKVAQASLTIAKEQHSATHALVDRLSLDQHPDVLSAAIQVKDAYVAKMRTDIKVPVSGMVTKRSVQVGQRVSPGASLMSVVSLSDLWVTANFKESQLRRLRVGQSVTLIADAYGRSTKYHGKLVGVDAGTGSAFSLLPAQNATGNWIKVVQRVPVRISLDPQEILENPLRIGLSMKVIVGIGDRSGSPLPITTRSPAQQRTTAVFNDEELGAEDIITKIILRNSKGSLSASTKLVPEAS